MGIRYRKRVKILPGVYINISKSGISTTVGPRGASVNFGRNGTYLNTGIPGTGLYSRDRISGSKKSGKTQSGYSKQDYNKSYSYADRGNYRQNAYSPTQSKQTANKKPPFRPLLITILLSAFFLVLIVLSKGNSLYEIFTDVSNLIIGIAIFAIIYIFFLLIYHKEKNEQIPDSLLEDFQEVKQNNELLNGKTSSYSSKSQDKGWGGLYADIDLDALDPMFADAARIIVTHNLGSTSLLQRKLSIGYNRAGRLMDELEKTHIVGPQVGGNPRDILIKDKVSLEKLLDLIELKRNDINITIDDSVISLFKIDVFSTSSNKNENKSSKTNDDDDIQTLKDINSMLNAVNDVLSVRNDYTFDINSFYSPPISTFNKDEQLPLMDKIKNTLDSFGIPITSMRTTIGPRISLFEVTLEEGQKLSSHRG